MYTVNPNISPTDMGYYKEEVDKLKSTGDFIQILEQNQAPIEYIDSTESDYILIAKDYRTIDKEYTHSEIESSLILSALTVNIPFPEHSQAPRNVFSSQQTKQAVGVYSSAYNTRFDTFAHVLHYPQKPIVTTKYKKYTHVDKLPYGCNCIVAIASYSGYNQEDAVILNKSSVQRGMFQSVYFRSYEDSEEIKQNVSSKFANPKYQPNVRKKNLSSFSKLDVNGFVKEGEYVTPDDMITGKCVMNGDVTEVSGSSIKFGTSGKVDKVVIYENKEHLRTGKVRIRKVKIPEVGDKFASRPGQKGVCGLLIDEKDMPFSKDGIVPDLIMNPHAIPSRMTINQLLEIILGKSCALSGTLGDATAFQNNDIRDYTKVLNNYGFEGMGNEVLYSGITGEQLKTSIFMGPIYYQRIKIMVADKMHSRGTGPVQALVRQPAAGRANNGGLRIGEMERDSILSHGMADFLNESMMKRSDEYSVQIDETTGLIDYSDSDTQKCRVKMPYAMKMMLQELQGMSVYPRLIIDNPVANKPVFQHLLNNLND
jgi:DNA-directed RNA polymerase II subunit RPB2